MNPLPIRMIALIFIFWSSLISSGYAIDLGISIDLNLDPICVLPMPPAFPLLVINPTIKVFAKISGQIQVDTFNVPSLEIAQLKIQELDKLGFFSPGRQVVFVTHGYVNSVFNDWLYDVQKAIMNQEDSTVFVVGWGLGSYNLLYNQAASNTRVVASVISALAEAVRNSDTFKNDQSQLYLYCIGHSLGAQICGQAGRSSGHFNRVTGLDPAGPGFETCWSQMHVNKSSAICVDNIHTDGSGDGHLNTVVAHYGTLMTWGHVDVYPNSGTHQTGCILDDFACSHMKAIDLFVYSVQNQGKCMARGICADTRSLPSTCDDTQTQSMGYFSSCHKSNTNVQMGNFYLTTNAISPYC